MQITRQQIIAYLQAHQTATAKDLSQSLSVTAANIRHHLQKLEQQGVIEEVGLLPPQGRGRPTRVFSLATRATEHNLDHLAIALLQLFLSIDPQEGSVRRIAKQMLGQFELPSGAIQRLTAAIQWLDDHHYRARWEASPSGPRIILGACPYLAILDSAPQVCQVDASLISQITGLPMRQTSRLERDPTGSHQCVFEQHIMMPGKSHAQIRESA